MVWDKKCLFAPSLICLDMCNLEQQVRQLEQSGIGLLHVDILDGHFSPSMPLGLETVRQLRQKTEMAFDCHVMADPPDYFIDELLDIGVQQVVFHLETAAHADGLLNRIHDAGVRAGVALKPATSLHALEYVLEKCDTVLLMLINPGYASSKSESQVPYASGKIQQLKEMISARGLSTKIELDGRISKQNIEAYAGSYADIFVAGTTCIARDRLQEDCNTLIALRNALDLG